MPDPRLLELLERLLRYGRGNIDLTQQPQVLNPDGSISTVDSAGFNIDGQNMLLPSVTLDGRHLQTDPDILAEYDKTGRHLGIFPSQEEADRYGPLLHDQYASGLYRPKTPRTYVNGTPIDPALGHPTIDPTVREELLRLLKSR